MGAEHAVRVELLDEAKEDLRALADREREEALEVIRLLAELRDNPHLGERMRATPPRILEPCPPGGAGLDRHRGPPSPRLDHRV